MNAHVLTSQVTKNTFHWSSHFVSTIKPPISTRSLSRFSLAPKATLIKSHWIVIKIYFPSIVVYSLNPSTIYITPLLCLVTSGSSLSYLKILSSLFVCPLGYWLRLLGRFISLLIYSCGGLLFFLFTLDSTYFLLS